MKIKNEELLFISGGAFNATLLNSIARIFTTIIEVGKMIGSSLRRIKGKNYC